MFTVLNKIENPDSKLTFSIRLLADKIFSPRSIQPPNLNDFSTATSRASEHPEITPVNIALVSEMMKYVAISKAELDENLIYVLKMVLEMVLPSQ